MIHVTLSVPATDLVHVDGPIPLVDRVVTMMGVSGRVVGAFFEDGGTATLMVELDGQARLAVTAAGTHEIGIDAVTEEPAGGF